MASINGYTFIPDGNGVISYLEGKSHSGKLCRDGKPVLRIMVDTGGKKFFISEYRLGNTVELEGYLSAFQGEYDRIRSERHLPPEKLDTRAFVGELMTLLSNEKILA